jgi:hypothetical protein
MNGAFESRTAALPLRKFCRYASGFIFETGGFIFEMTVSFLKYVRALFDW